MASLSSLKMSRRKFLCLSGTAATAGVLLYTWRVEPHWVELVKRVLPIRGLPDTLAGKTLVQLSDLHIGPVVDDSYLMRSLDLVSSLEPDILVLTGDFTSCDHRAPVEQMADVLAHIQPAKLATVAILGNHDYGSGWSDRKVAASICELLADNGVKVLRNSSVDIKGLRIIGFDDLWGPAFDEGLMHQPFAESKPTLVLCHNPDAVDKPIWGSYKGWILSGHTHGGQCKPPFLPPPLLPVRNRRYTAGEFDLHDGRRLYINRGLGYLRRVRFNVRPEITVFTLTADAAA